MRQFSDNVQVSLQLRPAAGQCDDLSGLVHGHGQAVAGMPQLEWRGLQPCNTITDCHACFPTFQQDKDGRFPDCVNLNLYETGDHQASVLLSTVRGQSLSHSRFHSYLLGTIARKVSWHSDDEPLFRGKFQDRAVAGCSAPLHACLCDLASESQSASSQDARIISVTLGAMRKFQVGLKAPRRGALPSPALLGSPRIGSVPSRGSEAEAETVSYVAPGGILKPERGSVCNFNLGHGQICTMEGAFECSTCMLVAATKCK